MRTDIKHRLARGTATLICIALAAAPGATQQTPQPIARYTMDVGTTSGMAAMAQGGRGGGLGAGLSMAFGGGGDRVAHELILRLGSTRTPTGGAAKADHFMPTGAGLGPSVPLATPTSSPGRNTPTERETPQQFQRPKGRLLIYWGCGAKAGPGQPVVIDFAKVAAGQVPPGLFANTASVPADWQITQGNSTTFGDWPNGKSNKNVTATSSLVGPHRIAGNYSPEINFALTQDFMPAITGRASSIAGGATNLSWNSVANATGYYAWVMGFNPGSDGESNDMVWWASSSTQMFGGALWDWLPPATVAKLIGQKVVMPPSQTSCTVPAEVKQSGGQFMLGNLYAYGPQADFAFPARPANPRTAWKPEWTARVRYRSNTTWMINGPMMGSEDEEAQDSRRPTPPKKCKGGLGGILAGAAGIGC